MKLNDDFRGREYHIGRYKCEKSQWQIMDFLNYEGGGGEEWQYVLKVLTRKQKVFLFCFSSSGVLLVPKYICQGNIFKNKEKKATTR